jgi:GNAT superfamily N-acetyltransferase
MPVGGWEPTFVGPLREIAARLPELIGRLPAQPLPVSLAEAPPITVTHRYRIDDEKGDTAAHVEVKDNGGVLWVDNLWVQADKRGRGYATALLGRAVGEWQGCELYLLIQPYTDQPLDAGRLAVFYGSFGFEATAVPGVLRRPARPWVGRPPREG